MSHILCLEYPPCSTCKKATAWLDAQGVTYTRRHIVQDNPTAQELEVYHQASALPIRRFFITSGMLYRQRNIKALLDAGLTDQECYQLLAEDGMLVKRPLLVVSDSEGVITSVVPGFKEDLWRSALGIS